MKNNFAFTSRRDGGQRLESSIYACRGRCLVFVGRDAEKEVCLCLVWRGAKDKMSQEEEEEEEEEEEQKGTMMEKGERERSAGADRHFFCG